MKINPALCVDAYKLSHRNQYESGTEYIYSNLVARSTKYLGVKTDEIVFFGLQYWIKSYLKSWEDFFGQEKNVVVGDYKRKVDQILGIDYDVSHMESLWDLQYLPLKIKALPEGTVCGTQIPLVTVINTDPKFFWLTNYIETALSAGIWKFCVIATLSRELRKLAENYSKKTCDNNLHVDYCFHDFSARGMSGIHDWVHNIAQLLFFKGSDTVLAGDFIEEYYNTSFLPESIASSEHSCIMLSGKENEFETYKRLIKTAETPNIGLVCDTWNIWNFIINFLPRLKDDILNREGKVCCRPDSGLPEDIICGTKNGKGELPLEIGCLQLLWNIFGGTINEKGYKVLNEKIGIVYGDAITFDRANTIYKRMEQMGFASSNIVFGVGSFTLNYNSRDSLGMAVKGTAGRVNGVWRNLEKDPITDPGKKSLCGLLKVYKEDGELKVKDKCTPEEESESLLETVFEDGNLIRNQTFSQIKELLNV